MSLTTEEICKIIRESWRFPPNWEESDMETMGKMMLAKPREIRCITYNIPSRVIYFFPKEADAIDFSENNITPKEKCKHDSNGNYGFDSLLQRCRDCGMSAIDIEIERSNDFKHKVKRIYSDKESNGQLVKRVGVVIDKIIKEEQKKNYCEPGDVLSRCKAGRNWKEHEKCRFSEKATRAERCMYFRDLNDTEHCDNHLAQKALYLSTQDSL